MKPVIIEKIELLELAGRKEVRMDWSNDRHMSVTIEFDDPEGVLLALDRASFLIRKEIYAGKLS